MTPAQLKAFAKSRGTRAKTDRIDAELIARFFAFRPDAGRSLPGEKFRFLRALTSKLPQIRAHQKPGTAEIFDSSDTELKVRLDSLIKELEDRIVAAISSDDLPSETVDVFRSIPGIGQVAYDSGTRRGNRSIAGGRRALRHVIFQAALDAAHYNSTLKAFADRLRKDGKPHKVIITAVARKLINLANALCKKRQKWVLPKV